MLIVKFTAAHRSVLPQGTVMQLTETVAIILHRSNYQLQTSTIINRNTNNKLYRKRSDSANTVIQVVVQ